MVENNAFYFAHVKIKVPWVRSSSISAVCSGQFYHSLLGQNKKYLKVELGLCFEIETAEFVGSRIFIVYSILIYSEKWPWKPHACYF